MKVLYTLLITAIASIAISAFTTENYIYYYCHSRTLNTSGKTEIRVSPVYAIPAADTAGWMPGREWGDFVIEDCNGKAATSDFNYYFSKADADMQFNNTMKYYSDTSKYILKRVDFRLKDLTR
jgi:hypothetical protein